MTFYTDQELAALLSGGESHLVERKRNARDSTAIHKNICAFANDIQAAGKPGVIVVGMEDDGSCSGIDVDDELLRNLAQMRTDGSLLPLPFISVERKTILGCETAVVQVAPSENPPVRFRGRVWIRVGPTVQVATSEEERRLGERRRAGDRSFDMQPVSSATVDDLDLEYLSEHYLPAAVAEDVLELNQRPLIQQLHSLRLLAGEFPTWGALLAFGTAPQNWLPGAYVQFLRVAGHSLTDPIKSRKELTGRLEDVMLRLRDLIEVNIAVGMDVTSKPREINLPDYPVAALWQLVSNAVMHRNYEVTNAPTRFYWYDDRIEIQSPGGLFGSVTSENIHHGVTDYRNPLVAEIMHHLGFAQRFGMGIQLTKQELENNGNPPPEFAFLPSQVSVTVRTRL
ncbi:MAG: transcriptional regulator [Caldilineaceae bacterium SB0661_bin_32]|uniref:Transcriptional regulator n=1 Tax=Caldilineaceae bacterium SB0661_bin_32 TaxID=2605255 RepID=A0A6B1D3C6_9CHLR|nr:transcriptional regulator [Caldilineaceae bacterium SB0661_bin_32]